MCTAAILLALSATQVIAASAAENAGETVIYRWDFDRPGDLEGWHTPSGMKDISVADGRLRFTSTNIDPFMHAPAVQTPIDGCVVRVSLRCRHKADTQVYWITAEDPTWSERQSATLTTQGQDAARTQAGTVLEFSLGKLAPADRHLTGFRIDPCNNAAGETAEIDFVELVRKKPVVQARLNFDRHHVGIDESVNLQVHIEQVDGAKDRTEYTIVTENGNPARSPAASQPARLPLAFDAAGVQQQRATVHGESGGMKCDLQSSIIVGMNETLPVLPALRGDRVRLDLIRAADGEHVGAARWMAVDANGDWILGGWLLPLVRLTVQQKDGTVFTREPMLSVHAAEPNRVRLEGWAADLLDWRIQLDFELKTIANVQTIAMSATLAGPVGGKLLEFSAPVLRVERDAASGESPDGPALLDRFGLFGGLEMLEPGWASSSERAVGERFAKRWAPHPFKITVPAMAIEAKGLTTCLFWQPMDKWDDQHAMPKAVFASPDFLDRQPNHLMALAIPGIDGKKSLENESYAREPYSMAAGQPLTLRAVLHAEPGLSSVMACSRWYQVFGAPLPPPQVHGDTELYNLFARSLGETMYNSEKKGWTFHWYFPQEPGFQPEMAAFLLAHAAATGDRQWVQRTNLSGRSVIDTAGSLASRMGLYPVAGDGAKRGGDNQDRARQYARALAGEMRPDGTWPFRNTENMRKQTREFTNGRYDSLGEDNATSLGTCAIPALTILEQAEMTGDPELQAAGLKALEAMRQFRVPRGAQVWEVPMEVPDIRASALAVAACHAGYRLTGNSRYLEDARYWAWAGVPFVHAWRVPIDENAGSLVASHSPSDQARVPIPLKEPYRQGQPQLTPYGAVPVLGTTFYVINWFGVLVQWCGLEWAQHVIELDADLPDPTLRYIADGVVLSGLQQMMDSPPWVGLYPDSWILESNLAQAALIYPGLIIKCRQAQGRMPNNSNPWTRVLRDDIGQRRWHVSGWGRPVRLDPPALSWSADVEFLPGEPNELVVIGANRPDLVRLGDEVLAPYASGHDSGTQPGWRYDAGRRAFYARFVQSEPQARIQVTWQVTPGDIPAR